MSVNDLNLVKLAPNFFDLQKSQSLMTQWKTTLETYAMNAKQKIRMYTIFYYSLNIPLFICSALSATIPLFDNKSSIPAAFSATNVILLGLMTHLRPDKQATQYYTYFTTCEKIKSKIIFYQSLNLDNNQLQLLMTSIETDIEKLVSHIPSDISDITTEPPSSLV